MDSDESTPPLPAPDVPMDQMESSVVSAVYKPFMGPLEGMGYTSSSSSAQYDYDLSYDINNANLERKRTRKTGTEDMICGLDGCTKVFHSNWDLSRHRRFFHLQLLL